MPQTTDAFFPAVVAASCLLSCLDAPGVRPLLGELLPLIRLNRSCGGSWNYWRRDSPSWRERPYPDDLDDTSLSIAILLSADHGGPKAEGQEAADFSTFIGHLRSADRGYGGPFNTWLTHWQDVDPIVNANIAFSLGMAGVRLAPLDAYLEECALRGNFKSKYYDDPVHVIYFLARAGPEGTRPRLLKRLEEALCRYDGQRYPAGDRGRTRPDGLTSAFILSTLIRCGGARGPIEAWAGAFSRSRRLKKSPCPLYIETAGNGTITRVGSPMITAAAMIEASSLYLGYHSGCASGPTSEASPEAPKAASLESAIEGSERCLQRSDGTRSIVELPRVAGDLLKKRLRKNLDISDIEKICRLGVCGWTAHSIYDAVRDRDGGELITVGTARSASLPAANSLADEMHFLISDLRLPHRGTLLLRAIFLKMEKANFNDENELPSRRILADSVWKSMGAAVPMLALLIKAAAGSRALRDCELYFFNLIAARQLSDDACDWEEDRKRGRRTPVIEYLNGGPFDASASAAVAQMILRRSRTSIRYARRLKHIFTDTIFLQTLPKRYEEMALGALRKQRLRKIFDEEFWRR